MRTRTRFSSSTSSPSPPPGLITSSYVSANAANTSGTLFVSSGGIQVAAITMVGHYSAGNFVITAGIGGTVAITDPTVPNGGSAEVGVVLTLPQHGIDLPNIAFGAQTDACLFGERRRHRRRADGRRRPPRRHRRAPWQLHGRKLRHRGRRAWRHAGRRHRADRAAADPRASAHVNAELLTRSIPDTTWIGSVEFGRVATLPLQCSAAIALQLIAWRDRHRRRCSSSWSVAVQLDPAAASLFGAVHLSCGLGSETPVSRVADASTAAAVAFALG